VRYPELDLRLNGRILYLTSGSWLVDLLHTLKLSKKKVNYKLIMVEALIKPLKIKVLNLRF